ncbi:MAG TPA: threonylcarbamoyl-AMP synthase [Candidatus Blautia merdavium]|uniref:Threonylcarbamoyl-AMP synthase n=1 Tax=Candidatus Blautia merdavium TaxID=2838494 RepID=A0A9D2TC97_9FIRM|nr:threonylcarbamoyl-AMP synthase [Candidatus Blautia merdavium]
MDTKVVTVDQEKPDLQVMRMAGEILRKGGLVAFPTETVYGLGGDGLNAGSSKKIYAAKGRPSDNPLIIHIADLESLEKIVKSVPPKAKLLAEKFWPGPLTMIFSKSSRVPYETTGGLESVAVRMPSHPVALAIIREGGGYIAAPSANTSGRPSPTRAEHVCEDLTGKIDMIVDGGAVGIGLESTIVDFTEEVPVILRPGYINQEMIQEVIGPVRMDRGLLITEEKVRPKAPGMKYRHYAPKAQLTIVQGSSSQVTAYINAQCEKAVREGKKPGVIAADETVSAYRGAVVKGIGARNDEEEIARNLFAVLREFDEEDTDILFSEAFDTPRMGQAIMNRLLKAAGHHIIDLDSSF